MVFVQITFYFFQSRNCLNYYKVHLSAFLKNKKTISKKYRNKYFFQLDRRKINNSFQVKWNLNLEI